MAQTLVVRNYFDPGYKVSMNMSDLEFGKQTQVKPIQENATAVFVHRTVVSQNRLIFYNGLMGGVSTSGM